MNDTAVVLTANERYAKDGGTGSFLMPPADEAQRIVVDLRQKLNYSEAEGARLNTMLSLHPDPILLVNRRREIVQCNMAALDLFGEDILQRDLAVAMRDPHVLAATDDALSGARTNMVEFKLDCRPERYFRTRISCVPNCSDYVQAALLTITEFTEIKRADQTRADFVASASHELRTPLSILIGFIETLAGSAADDLDAPQRFLPIMHDQAVRMARLVDDLLSLSCIELTEHTLPTERVELAGILRAVAQAFELRAAARGMWFELAIENNLPAVTGDPLELFQVFQNVIDNAVKYALPKTAIVIQVKPSSKLQPGVAVLVRDHGAGIAKQHLARLTERFYRVDSARSRALGGTGLGLAIVKRILNRHGGIFDIESEVGQGSCVTVHLSTASQLWTGDSAAAGLVNKQSTDVDESSVKKHSLQSNLWRPGSGGRSGVAAADLSRNLDRIAQ